MGLLDRCLKERIRVEMCEPPCPPARRICGVILDEKAARGFLGDNVTQAVTAFYQIEKSENEHGLPDEFIRFELKTEEDTGSLMIRRDVLFALLDEDSVLGKAIRDM